MQFGTPAAWPVALALSLIAPLGASAHLPPGFVLETYASGLQRPVDLEWTPNGLLFVAEKSGTVAVIENGLLLPTPFVDISDEVNRAADRGLLGIAVHPDFPATPWVYLLHDFDPPETAGLTGNAGPDGGGRRVARVTRVTADPATGYRTAVPGSEVVLLGKASTWANSGDPASGQDDANAPMACGPDGAFIDDCMPADGLSHGVGTVAFGPDGMLYVGNGDSSTWTTVNPGSLRALRLGSLAGKILRIDPATGLGLPDNPYWDGDANHNRSRVWQLGMRNPFRFRIHPNGELWVADVGWDNWEELNHAPAGADFGWPCYEGGNGGSLQQPGYASLTECQAYYAAGAPVAPVYAYPHRAGFGGSIIAGEFYLASKWPSEYQGTLMLSDYSFQELSIARITGGSVSVTPFADEILSVDLTVGPDGDIYSANVATDSVERIRYTGDGSGGSGGAGIRIAGFVDNFAGPAPATGWSYSWNAAGSLGDQAAETPLLWSDLRYDSDGVSGLPDATGMSYGFVGSGAMHPGRGQADGEAADRFAIARYAVPQNGYYQIQNGLIQHSGCASSNGVELVILTGEQIVSRRQVASGASDVIAADLGFLTAGTSIAVAVGPNGADGCDEVQIDWDIFFTPGEPQTGDAPVVTISSPQAGQFWRVGDIVALNGAATDTEDGVLGGDALHWDGTIIHHTHMHPDFYFASGASGTFVYPDHGDDSYVALCLTATDSDNQQSRACVDVRPELATYSFLTTTPGLSLTYNGESKVAPFSVDIPVGSERLISAPWSQGDYVFSGWSIGGQASQPLLVGAADQTLVASYVPLPGPVEQTASPVAMGSDDAEENGTGDVQVDSTDLNLTLDVDAQVVGIRFAGIPIEPGAVITDAYIQFTASVASSEPTSLVIEAQAGDSAESFLAQPGDVSSRPRTAARIDWSPQPWLTAGDQGIAQRSPNLAELVSAIVARPGWRSGNAIVFVISGNGHRLARSFNSPEGGAPVLVVSFANPPGGDPTDDNSGGGGGAIDWLTLAALLAGGVRGSRGGPRPVWLRITSFRKKVGKRGITSFRPC